MKIALIGNMNNNNFAIMRYFRDLGFDAHLLLYEDDGMFSHEHFRPEADTWNIEKWIPFITRMSITNSLTPALRFPWSWITSAPSTLRRIFRPGSKTTRPISVAYIKRTLSQYNHLVGSGNVPALCEKAGLILDIFVPYSTGVEYVGYPPYLRVIESSNYLKRHLMLEMRRQQIRGIAKARHVLNADVGVTEEVLQGIGIETLRLPMPMVYANEDYATVRPGGVLRDAQERIEASRLSILHHARIMWVNSDRHTLEDWRVLSKNTNWLLESFARLVDARPAMKPLLIMIEYGADVEHTKRLAKDLGIERSILWLPKMTRRELMWILSRVTIGCGEFYETRRTIWGGTGWETLGSGKPLLQAFNFDEGEFERLFGYPPPPMLPASTQEEILQRLMFVADHPAAAEDIGRGAKVWFNQYNGVGLAKKWLDLLARSADTEMVSQE
jgi:hypothetical protein